MRKFRVFLDESGDHTYPPFDGGRNQSKRFLGLTAYVAERPYYEDVVHRRVEGLKKFHFPPYDIDNPPHLHRSDIRNRNDAFGVLGVDVRRNEVWENGLLNFFRDLRGRMFTVVLDKQRHKERYPGDDTWDAYDIAYTVLLNRIRGYINPPGARVIREADVCAESRSVRENLVVQTAHYRLRTFGGRDGLYGTAHEYRQTYPDPKVLFRTKAHNVSGLQIADLAAHDQTWQTIIENGRTPHRPLTSFGARIVEATAHLVNDYGRTFLE